MKMLRVYMAWKVRKESVFRTHHWRDGFIKEFQAKNKKFNSLEHEIKIIDQEVWLIEQTTYYAQDKF
jgi:hypothetical protein